MSGLTRLVTGIGVHPAPTHKLVTQTFEPEDETADETDPEASDTTQL